MKMSKKSVGLGVSVLVFLLVLGLAEFPSPLKTRVNLEALTTTIHSNVETRVVVATVWTSVRSFLPGQMTGRTWYFVWVPHAWTTTFTSYRTTAISTVITSTVVEHYFETTFIVGVVVVAVILFVSPVVYLEYRRRKPEEPTRLESPSVGIKSGGTV